jgi:hypothetical protein
MTTNSSFSYDRRWDTTGFLSSIKNGVGIARTPFGLVGS